jgi:hypothetical protein
VEHDYAAARQRHQGGYGGLTLDPEKPGTIMVSTLDHYYPVGDDLWRSNNYGKTWYSINTVGAVRNVSLSPWVTFGAGTLTNTGNWPTAIAIDPYDSNHVVQGSGQTILTTDNIVSSDTGTASNWTIGALGVEETAVLGLISPPSGPANLLSVLGDLGGFPHTILTASPAAGAFANPIFANGTGINFAQSAPTIMARVGTVSSGTQFGAYSTNSGTSWTPFASYPANTVTGAGSIAVSADGTTFVWSPSDSGVATSYSTNNGNTWTAQRRSCQRVHPRSSTRAEESSRRSGRWPGEPVHCRHGQQQSPVRAQYLRHADLCLRQVQRHFAERTFRGHGRSKR